MASRLTPHSLLYLPPTLRTQLYRTTTTTTTTTTRTFSSAPSRRTTLVDLVTAGPLNILDNVHSLGIPWYATLPLTALLVRSTLVYYLSTLPARNKAYITSSLTPLTAARTTMKQAEYERTTLKKMQQEKTPERWLRFLATAHRVLLWNSSSSRLKGKFGGRGGGVLSGLFGGAVNFGVLVAVTEAIRVKCGTREGLLSIVLSPFEWIGRKIAPASFPAPAEETVVKDPMEAMVERLEATRQHQIASAQSGELVDLSSTPQVLEPLPSEVSTAAEATTSYFDPSLMTEGLPSIPNLTIPDPTLTLPVVMATTMALTFLLRPTATTTLSRPTPRSPDIPLPHAVTPPQKPSRLSFGQRVGLAVSLLFGFVAMNMPAAILLYLIPSIATGWAQQRWLDWRRPVPRGIGGCRRPVRLRTVKEWGDV